MLNFLPKIFPRNDQTRLKDFEDALIRGEAKIGGQLFGPVPKGHRREFFCLDEHTWIWHEEWSEQGHQQIVTTRYVIRPSGVIKTQDGQTYKMLSTTEARNLQKAAHLYYDRVHAAYQHMLTA
jgi:hypothetical protein